MDDDKKKGESQKDSAEGSEEKPWWAEMVKDVASAGLGTLFTTEETVRNYMKDKKLPKELITPLVENLSKKKDDFYKLLAKEVGGRFSKLDFTKEGTRFLEKHRVHVSATFEFEPKDKKEEEEES